MASDDPKKAAIDSVLQESRVVPPPPAFAPAARIKSRADYDALCARAQRDPEGCWREMAHQLTWSRPFERVLDWSNAPFARWFQGGQLNLSENCLDRHLNGPRRNKAAIIFEGEPGERRVLTYFEL